MSAYANASAPIRSDGSPAHVSGMLEEFITQLAERVAQRIAEQALAPANETGDWFDSRRAAEYLGVHRDTLRKLLRSARSRPSKTVLAASSVSVGPISTPGATAAAARATSR